ncbi:thiol-disulfide oxidoreductase DCC family protein [Burkholderia stagnalis]
MNPAELVLYFDGRCPLCVAEIRRLGAWNTQRRLAFVDIAAPGFDSSRSGVDIAALNRELHGRLPDGRFLTGVETIVAAYEAVGRGWRVWPLRVPVMRDAMAALYRRVARHRYAISRGLGYRVGAVCDGNACGIGSARIGASTHAYAIVDAHLDERAAGTHAGTDIGAGVEPDACAIAGVHLDEGTAGTDAGTRTNPDTYAIADVHIDEGAVGIDTGTRASSNPYAIADVYLDEGVAGSDSGARANTNVYAIADMRIDERAAGRPSHNRNHDRVRRIAVRWMVGAAAVHLIIGVALPWVVGSHFLDGYHHGIEQHFWPGAASVQARLQQMWWMSLLGATLQCMSVWMLALVHLGDRLRRRAVWGWLLAGLLVWAPQDMLISLRAGIELHVAVDLAALAAMVPPLVWLWRRDAA